MQCIVGFRYVSPNQIGEKYVGVSTDPIDICSDHVSFDALTTPKSVCRFTCAIAV